MLLFIIAALKAIMDKLDAKEIEIEKKLQTQKESLYTIVSIILLNSHFKILVIL